MTTRRDLIAQLAVASLAFNRAAQALAFGGSSAEGHLTPLRIAKVVRRDDTLLRRPSGQASLLTWGADGEQFMSWGDHMNWWSPPNKVYHTRMGRVKGDPQDMKFEDIPEYPDMLLKFPDNPSGPASFWRGSCLAVDGVIYQLNMTSNVPYTQRDSTFSPGFRFTGAKLIYSKDNGRTWHNQNRARGLDTHDVLPALN